MLVQALQVPAYTVTLNLDSITIIGPVVLALHMLYSTICQGPAKPKALGVHKRCCKANVMQEDHAAHGGALYNQSIFARGATYHPKRAADGHPIQEESKRYL